MRRFAVLVCVLALAFAIAPPVLADDGPTASASGVAVAAAALKDGPVYVHPQARDQMPRNRQDALAEKIKDADRPVFVAVLPRTSEFPRDTVLRDLRTRTGLAGVYAVQVGDRFGAGADPGVMSRRAVANLVAASRDAQPDDASAQLSAFADQAAGQARGTAPEGWDAGSPGMGTTGAAVLGLVIVAVAAGAFLVYRRGRRRTVEREAAELERLRVVVDEDITAFGEELTRIGFNPSDARADEAQREDYARALDAYETAKSRMDAARRPGEVRAVTEAVAEGRFALATLAARRAGEPLPERRAPCFFDPRHGPSVRDVQWSPPGAAPRMVPACGADALSVDRGEEPASRTVAVGEGRQPYWNAGPAYGPWAGGYFGSGLLPGLLAGTVLGQVLATPDAWAGADGADAPEGGDSTGADFDPDAFTGGFGGDGGGGGDFGGGGFGDF